MTSFARVGLVTFLISAILIGAETAPIAIFAVRKMDELTNRFDLIMSETIDYLDRAWEVAKMFRDPNYDYNPADLGNFTIPEGNLTKLGPP